jgi:hypothetical protein
MMTAYFSGLVQTRQLIFRMHNSDPAPQGVENRNILLWFNEKIYITLSEQFQQSIEKS